MTNPLQLANLPEVTLDAGCTFTFEALNPSTGATVTGVTVSNVALYGVNLTPALTGQTPPSEPILPYFVPIPEDEAA